MKINEFPTNPQWRGRVIDEAIYKGEKREKQVIQINKNNNSTLIEESSKYIKSFYNLLVLLILFIN